MKRFRHNLNELIYALQHEIRDPIRRAVAIDPETERATKVLVLNLKPEIEIRASGTRPKSLQEAQDAAFEAELVMGEIERNRNITVGRTMNRPIERANTRFQGTLKPMARTFQQDKRMPLTQRTQFKCFRYNQIGHAPSQCRNFQSPSLYPRPPGIHNIEIREEETEEPIDQTYELTPQQEHYPQCFYDPTDDNMKSSSTAEQELTYSREDVYYNPGQ